MQKRISLLVIALIFLLSACSYERRVSPEIPEGGAWQESLDNKRKETEEALKNAPKDTRDLETLRRESRFDSIIRTASDRHDVDFALVKAIMKVESDFDPQAVSPKGACGLMQLMPATANELGVKDCFSPSENINGGVEFFRKQLKQFKGNIRHALAAYNAGPNRVKRYKKVPPYPETKQFIKRVLSYHQRYLNYQRLTAMRD